ncbi:Bug family tripartite tricarboxylate transporter substrate binding protein [Bordetella parapertussis]|uniref:Exported protein n=1 Tax=Bordetella parapertussis (strain Bpp5) TaxID=1208660 RepID=K0MNG1_BORPB|nr:tripartite tricarboxylate transporter substrate-binding protein [Bordetella parapertussis]CCJ51378.1 putative exported protein [Bordetella parapertussis Bpp5]
MSRSHSFVSATRRALLGGALAVAAGLSWTAPAVAQGDAFPAKPLRFVVPYPPGGPLDSMARLLAEKVRESLGQPIIVENRSGAGGNIGADLVAKAAPAQLALLSGQSDFMFDNLAAAAPLIKDGKVKALAVTTAKRSSLLADVPTVEEAGVKGFDLGTWFGVFTTGGTPADVVAKLNKAYADAMRLSDVRQRLLTMGSEAEPMTADAFAAFVKQEMAKYQEIVKISGASLN